MTELAIQKLRREKSTAINFFLVKTELFYLIIMKAW